MSLLISFFSGLIFGLGLIVSGMTNPVKVIGFLDIFGQWDPSLAFVMMGAILVGFFAFRHTKKTHKTLLGETAHLPTGHQIDRPLLLGAALFGIGWGLAGYCPGPALGSLLSGGLKPFIFTASMIAGMMIFHRLHQS